MKPKHTPGPWTLDESSDTGLWVNDKFIDAHTKPNAQLISSAPLMFELLKECLAHLDDIPRLKHAIEDVIEENEGEG